MLDALSPEICNLASGFLRISLSRPASVVDFFSLLYTAALVQIGGGPDVFADSPSSWHNRVAEMLETFRTADGGYAKVVGAASGSTYHTFLVALCYELLGRPLPQAQQALRFVHSRRRDDGGFVEIAPDAPQRHQPNGGGRRRAANDRRRRASSSALTGEVSDDVIRFIMEMPSPEDGFRANGRAPLADLLSTFTSLWTLRQLGVLGRVDKSAVLNYVRMLELPGGGFRGGLWDDQTDVEYTFYGLGCLGVLAGE